MSIEYNTIYLEGVFYKIYLVSLCFSDFLAELRPI